MEVKPNDILLCVRDHKTHNCRGEFTKGERYVVENVYEDGYIKIMGDAGKVYFFTPKEYIKTGSPSLNGILVSIEEHRRQILSELLK